MKRFTDLRQLGPLEQKMLEAVWARGSATAGEVHSACEGYGYTTINTTLDRLYRKGLLTRELEGRRFRYSPAFTEAELRVLSAARAIRDLLAGARSSYRPILSHFVEVLADEDPKLLDELRQSIDQRRGRSTA